MIKADIKEIGIYSKSQVGIGIALFVFITMFGSVKNLDIVSAYTDCMESFLVLFVAGSCDMLFISFDWHFSIFAKTISPVHPMHPKLPRCKKNMYCKSLKWGKFVIYIA